MGSYLSDWTGRQIDDNVRLFVGKELETVDGIVQRDAGGAFFAAQSHSAAESGTTLSLVTTGEKYIWNHMVPLSQKGVANGVAPLSENGLINSNFLPSFVDDVLEGYLYNDHFYSDSQHTIIITDDAGRPSDRLTNKVYLDLSNNRTYRWGGSTYVLIASDLTLGETSTTAYYGDKGKVAYDHATAKGSAFASGLYKITTNAQGHVTAAATVVKSDITALGIPAQDTTYTFTDKDITLAWGERKTIATIGSIDIHLTMPNNPDTTYTFTGGTNGFTVTPLNGTAQIVTITPSITNNVTGTGTNGALVKFNGASTVTSGPALGSDITKFLRNDGQWAAPPGTVVGVTPILESGIKIATLTVDGTSTDLFAPYGSGGGSTVTVTQVTSTGIKIASINVDGVDTDLYAPNGTSISVNQVISTGIKIGTITVDGVGTDLFAPNKTSVSVTPITNTGTKIGTITVDGAGSDLYAPAPATNTKTVDGVVTAPTVSNASKVWGTDNEGNPNWKQIGIIATTTEDTSSSGLILELTCIPV